MGEDRGDAGIPDVRDAGFLRQLAEDRVVGVLPPLDAAAGHRPEPLVQRAGTQAGQEQPACGSRHSAYAPRYLPRPSSPATDAVPDQSQSMPAEREIAVTAATAAANRSVGRCSM